MKIHLWCPGIEPNSGGIEKYSSFLLKTLREQFGSGAISAFAKNDRLNRVELRPEPAVTCTGNVPEKFRTAVFSTLTASHALFSRANLIISTHLNFSPLARWLSRRANIPYWVSLHGVEAWDLNREDRRRGLGDASLLLPVSGFTRDVVSREQGLPRERFRLLPNAFDPDSFRIGPKTEYLLRRYDLAADQPVILTVGRLSTAERYKGQDRILRILSGVREQIQNSKGEGRNSEIRYLIVGDGDDRPRLEGLAEELDVRDAVIFGGKIPIEELNDHYNLCDLFAMPSTGEGFGIVFLEALACGKPVLAGNKDASRDALLDGEIGVLVDPDNPAELRDAMVSILLKKHPHPLIYQPEVLRRRAIEHFGFEKFKATLSGYLDEFFENQ